MFSFFLAGDQAEQGEKLANGKVPSSSIQWKQATQKKLVTKRSKCNNFYKHEP